MPDEINNFFATEVASQEQNDTQNEQKPIDADSYFSDNQQDTDTNFFSPDDMAEEIYQEDYSLTAEVVNDVINATCGKGENGLSKSAITVSRYLMDVDTNELQEIASTSSAKAIIDIQNHIDFIQIDCEFAVANEPDLKLCWKHFEKNGQALNEVDASSLEVPAISLTLVPVEFEGRYYIVATNPIFWTLQPKEPGQQVSTIRLLFNESDVNLFESNEIDIAEVEAIAQRRVDSQIAAQEAYYEKQREHMEQLAEKNARIEEERRNF